MLFKDFLAHVGARELFLLLVVAIVINALGAAVTSISHDIAQRRGQEILWISKQHANTTEETNRNLLKALENQQKYINNTRGIAIDTNGIVKQLAIGVNNSQVAVENQQLEFKQMSEILANQQIIISLLRDGGVGGGGGGGGSNSTNVRR